MYKSIIDKINNKKIAILGFGKEGKSTYNFIRKNIPDINLTILDGNENLLINNEYLLDDKNINFVIGKNYLDNLEIYDYIFKSPGVFLSQDLKNRICDKLTSQIDLSLELYRDNIIGITGTKGKTTTSSLIYKVLKEQNIDCLLLGNIGKPIFDYLEEIKKDTLLVVELSSYQLENVKYSPHISIILNLFQDHLNYHGTIENYHLSKLNIFKYQNKNDYALYNSDNLNINNYIKKYNYLANKLDILKEFIIDGNNILYKNKIVYDKSQERLLIGEHNLSNILFVLRLAILLDLDLNKVVNSINSFIPIEHRMEYVGIYNGIKYYNDVIATIPEATINCLRGINGIDTIIFGGMDRGIDYQELIDYFNSSDIVNFICMPDTGHNIAKKLNKDNIYVVDTLEEAVNIAKVVTKNICLLSPAAPSYNAFKNYEEKGNKFKELIKDN